MKDYTPAGVSENAVAVVLDNDSGIQQHLGFGIEVLGAQGSRITLDIGAIHLNRQGVVHGGIFSLLLDVAMGYACSGQFSDDAQTPAITLSMTINYLAPVSSGRVIATGRVTGGGHKILFAEAQLKTEDGVLVATSTGTMKRGEKGQA